MDQLDEKEGKVGSGEGRRNGRGKPEDTDKKRDHSITWRCCRSRTAFSFHRREKKPTHYLICVLCVKVLNPNLESSLHMSLSSPASYLILSYQIPTIISLKWWIECCSLPIKSTLPRKLSTSLLFQNKYYPFSDMFFKEISVFNGST